MDEAATTSGGGHVGPAHTPDLSALQESEARFRQIAESFHHVFWVLDLVPEPRVPYVSPAFERIWGRPAQALYDDNRLWMACILPEDHAAVELAFDRWLGNPEGAQYAVEYRITRPDGSQRWIADSGRPVRDASGQVLRVTGVAEDITERKAAQAAARSSDRRLRMLAESLPQLVWACQPDGWCDYLGPQWQAYTGAPTEQLHGWGWVDWLHPDDREAAQAQWQAALDSGADFDTRYRVRTKDGQHRWHQVRGVLVRDEEGRPERWLGTCTDIDTLQRHGSAAAAERDHLRRMAQAVPSVIHTLRHSPSGQVSVPFGGERLARLYGLEGVALHEDASGLGSRIHPDDRPHVREAMHTSRSQLTPWHAQYRTLTPEGQWRWVEGHATPVLEDDGGVLWHGALTDITQRKAAEHALQASQAQLQTVFARLAEGLVVCKLPEAGFDWNPAAMQLYGFEGPQAVPQTREAFALGYSLLDAQGRPLSMADWPMSRALRGEAFEGLELRLVAHALGWTKTISYGGAQVLDDQGQPLVAFVHMNDVTERRRHEAEVLRLNAELEQRVQERTAALQAAVKELEAFSYSVSHDLRAPLRAIDGFSQAVQQDFAALLPVDGQRYLGIIRDSAVKMGQLIDDLLAFSRVGRAPMKRYPVATRLLVDDALAQLAPQTEGRDIEWRIAELPDSLGDLALLRQVWINLLGNAVKYSRGRTPAVIEVGCTHKPGEASAFFVRDNGAGFDKRYAHKLFGVFERLHRADEFEGTGVGLAIVQRIVQRHGGDISAEGERGLGATFTFTLGLAA